MWFIKGLLVEKRRIGNAIEGDIIVFEHVISGFIAENAIVNIFVGDRSFHLLKRIWPAGGPAGDALERTVHIEIEQVLVPAGLNRLAINDRKSKFRPVPATLSSEKKLN